jgi:hypothetical protein
MRRGVAMGWLLCAWVLWHSVSAPGTSQWAPLVGYETFRECDTYANQTYQNTPAQQAELDRKGLEYQVMCLPTGADPRPPGKE